MPDGWKGANPYPEEREAASPPVDTRRLDGETVSLTLEIGEARHPLELSLMYDDRGVLHEIVFVGRGKIGQGLDLLLHDLGIKLSRAIQGRNPDTGAAL